MGNLAADQTNNIINNNNSNGGGGGGKGDVEDVVVVEEKEEMKKTKKRGTQSQSQSQSQSQMVNIGLAMTCAAELKVVVTAMLVAFTFFTFLQPRLFPNSSSDLLSQFLLSSSPHPSQLVPSSNTTALLISPTTTSSNSSTNQKPPSSDEGAVAEAEEDDVVVRREFHPIGTAAYNFITMSAYRGGPHTFAVVGLSSKPLHLYSKPTYLCQWEEPGLGGNRQLAAVGTKILPDWGYGRVYTVVVVNCTFDAPVNADNLGGRLLLAASTGGGGDRDLNLTDTFEVLREDPGAADMSLYSPTRRPKYEYLYCGSSLYGGLSPQRVREWVAYHVRLMGPKSHFVLHDAGGAHPEVMEVLRPWMELGYVTVHDIRAQERFDGYYHNQFMVVNDCLHRYRFQTRWMFFFDVDEYLYVPAGNTLASVLGSLSPFSQFTIEQMPMSPKLCLSQDYGRYYRKWGIEKLVYRDVKKGIRRDRKYAVQPRNVFATGVHMSANLVGKTNHKTEKMIRYFHYHGTIAQRREPCRNLLNVTELTFENTPYVLDTTMRDIAWSVKKFEVKMIGTRLQKTRQ